MKKILSFFLLTFSVSLCFAQEEIIIKDIPTINYEMLEKKIEEEKDVLLVLNFWSTTCAPCVKELPDFMKVNEKFKNNPKFKMLLVSLDRAKDKEKVIQFIKNKKLKAEVILLDDIKRTHGSRSLMKAGKAIFRSQFFIRTEKKYISTTEK